MSAVPPSASVPRFSTAPVAKNAINNKSVNGGKYFFLKVSALSAAAVPTGSRGADRYQGGMLMPSAPAPNAHRPVRRLRSESFKNSSFFCAFPQPFHGIFESPVAVFDSLFIKESRGKTIRLLPKIPDHCKDCRQIDIFLYRQSASFIPITAIVPKWKKSRISEINFAASFFETLWEINSTKAFIRLEAIT